MNINIISFITPNNLAYKWHGFEEIIKRAVSNKSLDLILSRLNQTRYEFYTNTKYTA